jgi:hypothetical protein
LNLNTALISISLATLLLSCAQLGGREGGGDALPNRGIMEYENASLGEPPTDIVLAPASSSSQTFGEPTTVLVGELVYLYVHSTSWDGTGTILLFTSQTRGTSFGESNVVAESPAGTGGILSSPSLSCIESTCVMAALAGQPGAIYLADGPPEGPFVWRDSPVIEATEPFEAEGISSPSLVLENDHIKIYYTARSAPNVPTTIAGGQLGESGAFEKWGPLVRPNINCSESSGNEAPCWNQEGNREPEVKKATSGTGRTLYRLLFTGSDGTADKIGFAASWDGQSFEGFAYNPILEGGQTQVSNIRVGDSYLMYYVPPATWDAGKIGLAVNEQGNATEDF